MNFLYVINLIEMIKGLFHIPNENEFIIGYLV